MMLFLLSLLFSVHAVPNWVKRMRVRRCKNRSAGWQKNIESLETPLKMYTARVAKLGTKVPSIRQRIKAYMSYAKAKRQLRKARNIFKREAKKRGRDASD